MPDNLEALKALTEKFWDWAGQAEEADKLRVAERHAEHAKLLESVVEELSDLRTKTKPLPKTLGDLSDLPEELIAELAATKTDQLEEQIFNIVQAGDDVDLDTILVELYRRFGVIQKRRFLQNKVYRMGQKGIIFSVPGRKGVYTIEEPKDSIEDLIDSDDEESDEDLPF